MHHLPDDRPRPDERHLDHQVVEALRLHARQGRHLRARLDLEHADGVGALDHRVGLWIVRRQVRQIDLDALVRLHQRHRVRQNRHHAQAQQIDLDDAEVGAVVLVPLHHHAARHRRRLERHHLVEAPGAHDHAARVLAEVARQPHHLARQAQELARAAVLERQTAAGGLLGERVVGGLELVRSDALGQAIDLAPVEAERLADLAHRRARPIGDAVGGHGAAALAVLSIDVLDDLLAPISRRQDRDRCRAIRRAPPTGSARTAAPCRWDRRR